MKTYSKCESCESMQTPAAGHAARQGKRMNTGLNAPVQKQDEEELQMKAAAPAQRTPAPVTGSGGDARSSGLPESVQTKMEGALNTDLSGVSVHANSSKATSVGALAYTQGADIHVAPGHYNPNTSAGKRLLGHELTHVAQQMAGRVQPTGEVGGLPLNDSPTLESEADALGAKAV